MSNEIRKEELFGYLHEYDGNGNEIHCKTPYGYEHHQEFDENGNMINYKNSWGYESFRKYDENGTLYIIKVLTDMNLLENTTKTVMKFFSKILMVAKNQRNTMKMVI